MNAEPITSRPGASRADRVTKKSRLTASTAASPSQPQSPRPANGHANGGERVERTETGSASARTWERSTLQPPKAHKEVDFVLEINQANEVLLAGDFTDWQKNPIQMRQAAGGTWHTKVVLPTGRHLYRFMVDGQWYNDPTQVECVPNAFGSADHVIEVT
jgi:hypothetical protein